MKLYLVRHGQSTNNACLDHNPDPPLTALGNEQARLTAEALVSMEIQADALYAGPQRRALQTLEPIRQALKLTPTIRPDMCETGGMRERLGDQLRLLDIDSPSQQTDQSTGLPFPAMTMGNSMYKVGAIVTNRRTENATELIQWHYGRCGKSEEAHSIMKEDFAGGQMPSSKFGANAAWWAMMILSMNFESMLKRLVLGDAYVSKRMKAVRHALINTAGRIVHHSRQFCLRVSRDFHNWLETLRRKAMAQHMT